MCLSTWHTNEKKEPQAPSGKNRSVMGRKSCKMDYFSVLQCIIWITILFRSLCCAVSDDVCFCVQDMLFGLHNPVHVESTKIDGSPVYLVAEQYGVISMHRKDTQEQTSIYMNLTGRVYTENTMFEENGLLSFALHPDFEHNGKIYTYSIRSFGGSNFAVVGEVANQAVEQEKLLLLVEQPGSLRNGGQVVFGHDGYLYVMLGDGGPSSLENIQALNGSSLLGKILRLDVSKTVVKENRLQFYDIPPDNPHKKDWKPEIFAIGVRNVWRCSVDKGDHSGEGQGRIFCGDLGSDIADEVNLVRKGANYGWPRKEGLTCLQQNGCQNISDEVLPVYSFYRGTSGTSAVVSGPIYRANWFPEIRGQLVLGDFVTGNIKRLEQGADGTWSLNNFTQCHKSRCSCNHRNNLRKHLLSIGEDEEGEVLLLMTDEVHPVRAGGGVLRLVPPSRTATTCGTESPSDNRLLLVIPVLIVFFEH